MNFRPWSLLVVVAVLTIPLTAEAQPVTRVPRIGFLSEAAPTPRPLFTNSLRELGWREGETVVIERRYAHGDLARLREQAHELVQARVDVIVAELNHAIAAAQQATTSIPIVMMFAAEPLSAGFVKSLAHPGGNVTGTTIQPPEFAGKALELLRAAIPRGRQVDVLLDPSWPGIPAYVTQSNAAAQAFGFRVEYVEVRGPADIESALGRIRRKRPDALLVVPVGAINSQRQRIVAFALEGRLPTLWPGSVSHALEGGLMSYGMNAQEVVRQTAAQVDKILRGTRPADIPVEQPTTYELAVNLKTARAIGVTIPPSVLGRADRVIE